MKSESEKKLRRVSTRMTEDQYKLISQKASENLMSVSAFMVDAAAAEQNHLSPQMAMKLLIYFNEAADACELVDPELAERLRNEGDMVWGLL